MGPQNDPILKAVFMHCQENWWRGVCPRSTELRFLDGWNATKRLHTCWTSVGPTPLSIASRQRLCGFSTMIALRRFPLGTLNRRRDFPFLLEVEDTQLTF